MCSNVQARTGAKIPCALHSFCHPCYPAQSDAWGAGGLSSPLPADCPSLVSSASLMTDDHAESLLHTCNCPCPAGIAMPLEAQLEKQDVMFPRKVIEEGK